ncbi:hypothetical protein BJY04DRAFT_219816 [Aspergillus karnatakaensis]|uniref:uncharacterized protein n=1 Tax=Aspergillus karnatakaensis TaxID=1810916 RepID=UPI003CCD5181
MPMTWNAEANAKFVLGILDQLKQQNVKLSYQKLADFMGPGASRRFLRTSILQSITDLVLILCRMQRQGSGQPVTKLRKQAALISSRMDNAGAGVSAPSTPTTPLTPGGTPRKRRGNGKDGGLKTGSPAKKARGGKKVDVDVNMDEDEDELERKLVREVKKELEDLNE